MYVIQAKVRFIDSSSIMLFNIICVIELVNESQQLGLVAYLRGIAHLKSGNDVPAVAVDAADCGISHQVYYMLPS